MSQGLHLRKYGVQTTIEFELYEVDGVDLRTDWTPAQSDCEIEKNEGGYTICDNTASGTTTYKIVLTATEMEFARGALKIVDSATKAFLDKIVYIETYGNASAMHAFDLDTASVAQTADNDTKLSTNATEVGKIPKSDSNVTWNATALGSIEAEAVDALESFNLDTLAGVDTGVAVDGDLSPHVVTGSVFAHIMAANKDVTTSYNASTDSLEAIRVHADTIKSETSTIVTDTNEIQGKLPTNKFMGSSDGADDDGTLNTIATDTTTDIPALIATAQADLDTITGGSGVLIDTDAVDADALAADAVDKIIDEVVEGSITLRQAIRLFLSVQTGLSSGGGTDTIVFRDIGDTKNRISATVDATGNRTAIGTRDGS